MNIVIPTFVFKNNNDYLDNEYRCILDLMVDTEIRKITVKYLTEKKNYAARIPERWPVITFLAVTKVGAVQFYDD